MSATILIIEDHTFLRETLKKWLEMKFPYCRIVESANSTSTLDLIQTATPKIIILDMGSPGSNGLNAVKTFRKHMPTTPIVVLGSFDNETIRSYTISNGASVYISKRAMLTELQPAILKLLSQNHFSAPQAENYFIERKDKQ